MAADWVIVVDASGFAADVRSIGTRLRGEVGQKDFRHLRKIERIGRLATILGFSTAWIFPNPFSAFLIAQGMIVRFTIGHHIGHGAYDRIKGIPERYTSKVFARGWRRFIDWPEWWTHGAWLHLHNRLHHPNTQDANDADLMNPDHFSHVRLAFRYLVLAFFTMTWKFSYYAPYMEQEWIRHRRRDERVRPYEFRPGDILDIANRDVGRLWLRRYLPYLSYRFALPTLLCLPFGLGAATNVLLTIVLAELIHNTQTFVCIRSSHSAPDLPMFAVKGPGRQDYYARQVLATANYNGGSDITDILHGWTNYQIEHHLWPDGTLLQFQKARTEVKAACLARGIRYIQENVLKRYWMMSRIFLGLGHQPITVIENKPEGQHNNSVASEPPASGLPYMSAGVS